MSSAKRDKGGDGVLARPLAAAVALVVLGAIAWSNAFGNRALFRHVPDPYRDPVLENSILRGRGLMGEVFGGEFLLSSCGEYRPLGYGATSVLMMLLPGGVEWPWHLVMLALHVATALLAFFLFRGLKCGVMSFVLAAAWMLHPALVPFRNDVNMIYYPMGMMLGAASLLAFERHLALERAWLLVLSVLLYGAAIFTLRQTAVLPVFAMLLCLFADERPRTAAIGLAYLFVGASLLDMFGLGAGASAGILAVAVIAAAAVTKEWAGMRTAMTRVPVFLVAVAALAAVAGSVEPRYVHVLAMDDLEKAGLFEIAAPGFVAGMMLSVSALGLVAAVSALAIPAAFLARGDSRLLASAAPLALLLVASFWGNRTYRDDVTYWQAIDGACSASSPARAGLATALVEAGRHKEAAEILVHLKYDRQEKGVIEDLVHTKLGRASLGMGDEMSAGYFYFRLMLYFDWYTRVKKNSLLEAADFSFRTGYITCAEHFSSCALVLDPYDTRAYNNLGMALVYKNFFRAGAKHFERTLELDPTNERALYYMAFISKILERPGDLARYTALWKAAAPGDSAPDFAPIYAAYSFDVDRMRSWFSAAPLSVYSEGNPYVFRSPDGEHRFPGVPLSVGRYFLERGNDKRALEALHLAHQTDPGLREPVEKLVGVFKRLGYRKDAEHYEMILRGMPSDGR